MSLLRAANNLSTNLIVTVLVGLFVLLLPLTDRSVCKKLGIEPRHRSLANSREGRLLILRDIVLLLIFFVYIGTNIYLVFFSRAASEDYLIHVAPLNDLINSVRIDSGIIGVLRDVYTQGLSQGFSHIHVEKPEDIAQVYMNVMLYVPMGYLLPYIFDHIRAKVRIRPVLWCFLISFITENLQLIFRRGFYDMDDLIANTFGGLVGQWLYLTFAYVVEHPDWRDELKKIKRWKHRARKRALFPFAAGMDISRTTIYVADESLIMDFYVKELGFRPVKKLVYEKSSEIHFLLQLGKFQLEIICKNDNEPIEGQYLTFTVRNVIKIRRRLLKGGYEAGEVGLDPYSGLRSFSFYGPEDVSITFIEG